MAIFGPHEAFDIAPHLGWEVGDTDDEKVYFIFVRTEPRPVDWQGGVDIVSDRIPGGNRTLYQDLGAQPLVLATTLAFKDKATFHKFRRLARQPGLLRMNADYSIWPGDTPDPVRISGRDYVEFSNVIVTSLPSEGAFDVAGAVYADVTFAREDGSWS